MQAESSPALPQHVQDVVSEGVSVLLQHPPHVVHHLHQTTRVRQRALFSLNPCAPIKAHNHSET